MAAGWACGGDHERAAELLAEGIQSSDLGHLSQAVTALTAGLAALGEPLDTPVTPTPPTCTAEHDELAARVLLSLAFPTHELGRTAVSLEMLVRAEHRSDQSGSATVTVLVRAQHGVLLLREGQIPEAIDQLDRAAELLEDAPPADRAKIMVNRGEAHHLLGQIQPAIADFTRALGLARQHELPDVAFAAQHNLGYMQYLAGDLPRSLALMPQIDDAESDHYKGVVGIDRAKVLLGAGLVGAAEQTLVEARAALARTELVPLLAEAELTQAEVALLADQPDRAVALATGATERLRDRDNVRSTALAELVLLRVEVAAGLRTQGVRSRADALAVELDRLALPDRARLARLVGLEAELASGPQPDGRPTDSPHADGERAVVEAPPKLEPGEPIELRLRGRLVRAQIARARGDRLTSRQETQAGLSELAAHQAQLGSLDLQTAGAAHGAELAVRGILDEIDQHHPTAVLALLERGRAISGRVTPVHPPEDPKTADLLTQLRWVSTQIEQRESTGRPTGDERRRRRLLQRAIRARSWVVPGRSQLARVPEVDELRAALGAAALVAVFRLRTELWAVVLTDRACWTQPLGPAAFVTAATQRLTADLDVLALTGLAPPLRAAAAASYASELRRLDDRLLQPLKLPDAPLVLLPPGSLSALPWGHLPGVRRRPVTVAPSASAWLRATQRASTGVGVVAIAGPGLLRAEDEVRGVEAQWAGCRTLIGDAATCGTVLSAIDGAGLVHFAAHGHHQSDSPLFSSLRLHDGPLVGYDLDRLARPPDQVVLSACDLGQATGRPGDESLGLTRALLHSGTRTVIAGVAKVSDVGAAAVMADYHHRLAGGTAPAVALAAALADAPDPMPFVCFGAGW